ncbi:MAG: hypothetical protein K0R31_1570 [Clostridiales bacterium]|nr:hypothetical protein [Clostridiales bacterium]
MQCRDNNKYPVFLPNPITQVADMPYPLYLSLQGKYFVGYADEMEFGNGTIAWAGLVNPVNSGINLHVQVWTVTNIGQLPLLAEVWFNTDPPGRAVRSELVTPANTAIRPLPRPRVKLLQASNVLGEPEGGIKMFERSVEPEITIASEENGALIFPPGGSLIITLSYPEEIDELGLGRVAFGWWEEEIK